jgi:hypothetical protein
MDFNATIDLIIKDLKEASEIIDDLKKCPGVPALQVELAKSKCRSAGDVIALLKDTSDIIPGKTIPAPEKQAPQKKEETVSSAKPVRDVKPPEEKRKVLKTVESSVNAEEKFPLSEDPVRKSTEATTLADKFSASSDLYEKQASLIRTEKDLSDQLKSKSITSLSDAIGISDKFLFMGEIFDGDKDAYAQAISRLDKAESIQDATAIIMSYTGEKTESEAVSQLLELVKLKLPSNE